MANITVYSTPICTKCNSLKDWLQAEGIKYDEVDLFEDTDKAQEFREKKMMNLPIVEKNGDFILGWSEATKDFITA